MSEPTWIDLAVARAVDDEQLAEHGGRPGVRDRGLLESALARPRNQFACGETSAVRLAASYAFGISRNHPFLDGNKRTSLVIAELFLELNDFALTARYPRSTRLKNSTVRRQASCAASGS